MEKATFRVVVNSWGQYSLLPESHLVPDGWRDCGITGAHEECLEYIERTWTDLRPLPVRSPTADGESGPPRPKERPATVDERRSIARGPRTALPGTTIHELIARAAEADPEATALRSGNRTINRGELDALARQWAGTLAAHGVGPGRTVAMLLPRSIEAVVLILGILKSGAAYLPISPDESAARLTDVLTDAHEPLVVTDADNADRLSAYRAPVLVMGAGGVPPTPSTGTGPAPEPAACDDIAYVMYTSGTTGSPKGVRGTHRQLINYVRWCGKEFALDDDEHAVLYAPLHFVGSVMTVFTPLAAGWELEVVPEPLDFQRLIALVSRGNCGFLKLTPSHVSALTALRRLDGTARQVMITSETLYLTPELRGWMQHSPGARFVNQYGMSETCGGTCHTIALSSSEPGQRIPVGPPIANAEAVVLDEEGDPVPFRHVGELCLAGDVIGDGYHGRPGLTAQRWIPHPWGEPGQRLLRTGDRARMAPDGTVEIIGRMDRQVKIRGHRVAPAAVEQALRQCAGVSEAVVTAETDGDRSRLVAYLRPAGGSQPTVAELRAHLAESLPDAAIPSVFNYVGSFPLTGNGKVDRTRLAEVPTLRPDLSTAYIPSESETEKRVVEIFQNALGIDHAGVSDDFFELGGDSIKVIEIITTVNDLFDADVSVDDFMDHPTARGVSACVEKTTDS